MIFFGKSKIKRRHLQFGVSFIRKMKWVIWRKGKKIKKIPHYYLMIDYGHGRCWIGANRFKRIVKDQIYELDGVRYPMRDPFAFR